MERVFRPKNSSRAKLNFFCQVPKSGHDDLDQVFGPFCLWPFRSTDFQANSVLGGEIRPSLLDNERVYKTYIHILDNTTRPFASLPQFKSAMGQRRVVSRIQTYQGVKVFGSRITELYFGHCRRCRVAHHRQKGVAL